METKMISNLFIPRTSKQFRLRKFEEQDCEDTYSKIADHYYSQGLQLPFGLWDSWKLNSAYKELVELLKIKEFSNDDAIDALFKTIYQYSRDKWIDEEDKDNEVLMEEAPDSNDELEAECETKTIALWRTTKLRYCDIALKLGKSLVYVQECVRKYKKLVKEQKKVKRMKSSQRRRVISQEMVNRIDRFCWKNRNRPLTLGEIKEGVWRQSNQNKPPWNSTIAKVLKSKLRMSYRTLSTRHPKTKLEDQSRLYFESSLIQTLLAQQSWYLVFIDEFHLASRN